MGCCNFICENYKVDGQKVVLSTIVKVFFHNKRKISTESVRKDNLPSFKKQKREAIFLRYSLVIIFYLLLCTLSYLHPRSVLIFQSFYHPQLTYFATPLKKWGGKFLKGVKKVNQISTPCPFNERKKLKNLSEYQTYSLGYIKFAVLRLFQFLLTFRLLFSVQKCNITGRVNLVGHDQPLSYPHCRSKLWWELLGK